jgi:anhydro-N-acetylmuramic acid kinase
VANRDLYVGLMSGTSLDGVDAILADLSQPRFRTLAHSHVDFDSGLRKELLALSASGPDEIERAGRAGLVLAEHYAQAVELVRADAGVASGDISAIGCHGQTVRHRPDQGFTVQIGNPALLAERTGIRVVADFRSRDMAAGGQGAPLVPAFHAVAFASATEDRAVVNIGGIANVTLLPRNAPVLGFDTGPGNCLMDFWVHKHLGKPFDSGGAWAAAGNVSPALLARMLDEPYFRQPAPKSSGRELFNPAWLGGKLDGQEDAPAVQAALLELTAESIASSIEGSGVPVARLIVCGGGAYNTALMARLTARLAPRAVASSAAHGLDPSQVEAMAFAWLAWRAIGGRPGNVPEVTGAKGPRVLGAIYPA